MAIVTADHSYMTNRGLDDDTVDCVIANDTEGYRLQDRETAYPLAIQNAFGTDPDVLADASPSTRIEREGAPSTRYLVITRGSARRQEVASEFVDLVVAAIQRGQKGIPAHPVRTMVEGSWKKGKSTVFQK